MPRWSRGESHWPVVLCMKAYTGPWIIAAPSPIAGGADVEDVDRFQIAVVVGKLEDRGSAPAEPPAVTLPLDAGNLAT